MKKNWNIDRFSRTCQSCDSLQQPGETYVSVLSSITAAVRPESGDTGERESSGSKENSNASFKRLDFCSSCWDQCVVNQTSDETDDEPEVSFSPVDTEETLTGTIYSFWQRKREEETSEETDKTPEILDVWKGFFQDEIEGKPNDNSSALFEKLRYLVTLLLERKGVLSLENEQRKNGNKYLVVSVRGSEDEQRHVREPEIEQEDITALNDKLCSLFDIGEDKKRS